MTSAHTEKGKAMHRIVERLVKFEEWENKYGELLMKQLNEGKEVVRCGECKWSKANGTYQWCGRLDSTARITPNGFCSYGSRSEKPNNSTISKMEQVGKE